MDYKSQEAEFNALFENFKLSELSCNDLNKTPVPRGFIENYTFTIRILQFIRYMIAQPIHINSGYRTPEYNKKISGAPRSYHVYNASAIDFRPNSMELLPTIYNAINYAQRNKLIIPGGLHLYKNFIHIDTRGKLARW